MAIEPLRLKFLAGLDNRSREYALASGAARILDNVDVTRDGGLISRKGVRAVLANDSHSLFSHPNQQFMLAVYQGNLIKLAANEGYETLVAGVGRTVYAVLNDAIYWTDGAKVGQVNANGSVGQWGMNNPPTPVVSAASTGGLYAGTYQVAMTAVLTSGLESGCTETVSLEVAEGGGIQVITPNASGVRFTVYRTPAQGAHGELRAACSVDPNTTVILGVATLGKPLESLHAVRPLPGQCLIQHKGRLWCASGNVVWFTSERSPHWLFPNVGYYQFESPVTMLGATEDGIYVGLAARIYYLQGNNPLEMQQRPVAVVGAAALSGGEIPSDLFLGEGAFPSRQCVFYDTEGFLCIGKPGGIIVRPTKAAYSAGTVYSGAVVYQTQNGLRQLVAGLAQSESPFLAQDVAVAEVFANGIVLG